MRKVLGLQRSFKRNQEKRRLHAAAASLAALGAVFSLTFSSPVLAASLKPEWSQAGVTGGTGTNSSYMSDMRLGLNEVTLRDQLVDPGFALEMRQNYETLQKENDLYDHHSLQNSPELRRARTERMSNFTHDVLRQIRNYQVRKGTKAARQGAEKDPDLNKVVRPIVVAAAMAAIYTGQPFDLKMSQESRVTVKTDVPSQKGYVRLQSDWFNSTVDYVGKAPDRRDPYAPIPVDATEREEQYKVTVSRGLPLFDLSSGVTYGSTTSTWSAWMSKQLTHELNAVVSSSHSPDPRNQEKALKLFYGLTF